MENKGNMPNKLRDEKSPYLLQHAYNPVNWYPWCEEAFEKAKKEDKPIFLSIGYSLCHWCHRLAHESFEDEEVAEILNENFISIKVDREERPDIDSVYMSVCQAMTGSGGWPLTIIMTPEQKPFFAGTYFPKHSGYGSIGLMDLLRNISGLWESKREELIKSSEHITKAVFRTNEIKHGKPDISLIREAYDGLKEGFDYRWGGFGKAPKFPSPHNLLFLMDYCRREDEPDGLAMVEITLENMAKGGIFDQIGGGFSRYSTDDMWLIPHFEKMLYDNALLIISYIEAYRLTQKESYARIATRTADYILSELTDSEGGFYCGQDADSDGTEGMFYAFTKEEISEVLGSKDGEEFCHLYGIGERGNFEGKSIPNLIGGGEGWNSEDERLRKLYDYRVMRSNLPKDDKILLSWNSWAIIAMARAGEALKRKRYSDAAIKAQQFIEKNMTDENNRLILCFRGGEGANAGQLEDYAVYALALLELYRATFDVAFLKNAITRAEQMLELFEDEKGGYFINTHDSEQLIARPKETYDGAMPSGNSVAAMVFEDLSKLTGERRWTEASDRQHRFMAAAAERYPQGHNFYLMALLKALYPHKELVCTAHELPGELKEYLRTRPTSELSVLFKSEDNSQILSECAPFTSEYPVGDRPAWYLCENGSCRAAVKDFSDLEL